MNSGPTNELHGFSTLAEVLAWRALRQPGQLAYAYLLDGPC
jgi:hypothetical protein